MLKLMVEVYSGVGRVCDVCELFGIDPESGLELRASLHHQGTPACLNHRGPISCGYCDTPHVLFLENRYAKNPSCLAGDTIFRCYDIRLFSSALPSSIYILPTAHEVLHLIYLFFLRKIFHFCLAQKAIVLLLPRPCLEHLSTICSTLPCAPQSHGKHNIWAPEAR